jgi:enoyl-CoA hydratase/carnithine racemase
VSPTFFAGPTLTGVALRLEWIERGIALITLTRPKQMNSLSLELLSEFDRALDLIDSEKTRVLIVTGEERAFCCGAHLRYFAGDEASIVDSFDARDRYLQHIAVLFDRLEELPFPTIASINGYALGGGGELALSCDFRVMSEDAKIGLPETKIGAVAAAGGVQKLIRHVGRSKALDWILRATHIDAATAERHGLCSAVVPRAEILQAALDIALELRKLGPRAIAQSKRAIYLSEDADLRTARRYGLEAISMLVGGAEWKEGMSAFIEKRPPAFDAW